MSYKNPLAACGGNLKWGDTYIPHVTSVEINKTSTHQSMVTSSTDGKVYTFRGCPDVTVTATFLMPKDATSFPMAEGDIEDVTADASDALQAHSGEMIVADMNTSIPIREGDMVSVEVTLRQAEDDAS